MHEKLHYFVLECLPSHQTDNLSGRYLFAGNPELCFHVSLLSSRSKCSGTGSSICPEPLCFIPQTLPSSHVLTFTNRTILSLAPQWRKTLCPSLHQLCLPNTLYSTSHCYPSSELNHSSFGQLQQPQNALLASNTPWFSILPFIHYHSSSKNLG